MPTYTSSTYHASPVDDFLASITCEEYYRDYYDVEAHFCEECGLEPEVYED